MFPTPYSTTVCKDYVLDKIVSEIQKTTIMEGASLRRMEENVLGGELPRNIDVLLLGPDVTQVPPFAHPLFVKPTYEDGKEQIILDVRNFTRLSRTNEIVISSILDYQLAVARGILSGYWYFEHPDDLLGLGNVQITIFARWLTDIITRRLALAPETQMRVTIIAAYYYLCLFREEVTIDDKEKLKMASKISQAVNISADRVMEVLDRLQVLLNVNDFIAALISTGDTSRFNDMNLGLLYTIVGGSWFGSNHKEIVACALEHPPTFIALCFMAMKERGYRRTILGKTVELNTKKGEDKSFLYNLHRLPV